MLLAPLYEALYKYGPKIIFVWLIGLMLVMLLPLVTPSEQDAQLLIASDLLALGALCTFVWIQTFIRDLFDQWITGEHPGMFSQGTIKFLLLLNSAIFMVICSYCLSLLTYHAAMKFTIYNPFERTFPFGESLLFFADQAMKGLLFDVSNVFDLHLQSALHVDARRHPIFGVMLVIYRLMMAYFTVTIIIQSWRRWLERRDTLI